MIDVGDPDDTAVPGIRQRSNRHARMDVLRAARKAIGPPGDAVPVPVAGSARRVAASWRFSSTPLHILVVRPAAALRRDPDDVAVGVLDVAGLAVDAVLRIDDVTRIPLLVDPFIDAGRAVARRGAGKHVMLG